jgi:hypothetical protein
MNIFSGKLQPHRNKGSADSKRSGPESGGGQGPAPKAGIPIFVQRSLPAPMEATPAGFTPQMETSTSATAATVLADLWQSGNKGQFFQKLRMLEICDPEINRFVEENLYGDDYWLAKNLLTYGPEFQWPIHLKVEREMKGWGDSGGKARVFDILRDAAGMEATNFDLFFTLAHCFDTNSDDFWLALNLMDYGREDIWPINLQIERLIKGWPGVDGSVEGILSVINGQAPDNQTAIFEFLQQLHLDYIGQGKLRTRIATIEKVLHALYARIIQTTAPGLTAPEGGWPSGGAPPLLLAGTKPLSASQKQAARSALTPAGKSAENFLPVIAGKGTYEARVRKELTEYINKLYRQCVVGKGPVEHADPDKVYPSGKILNIGKLAKKAADSVFKSYKVGNELAWNVNIADRFELEQKDLQSMSRRQKREKARVLVYDLIQMNATIRQVINKEHNAKPDRTTPPPGYASQPSMAEASILKRIVAAFTNEPHEVERLNQIDRGWPAVVPLGGGTIQIQMFKASTDTGNRIFLWKTFQALIHEYTHTLAHADYNAYAQTFGPKSLEWNTLIEGVNSLLTEIVWSNVNISELRQEIEGQRLATLPLDPSLIPITEHRYSSYQAAMRLVKTVGIQNLYAAYFLGRVDLIGR